MFHEWRAIVRNKKLREIQSQVAARKSKDLAGVSRRKSVRATRQRGVANDLNFPTTKTKCFQNRQHCRRKATTRSNKFFSRRNLEVALEIFPTRPADRPHDMRRGNRRDFFVPPSSGANRPGQARQDNKNSIAKDCWRQSPQCERAACSIQPRLAGRW